MGRLSPPGTATEPSLSPVGGTKGGLSQQSVCASKLSPMHRLAILGLPPSGRSKMRVSALCDDIEADSKSAAPSRTHSIAEW